MIKAFYQQVFHFYMPNYWLIILLQAVKQSKNQFRCKRFKNIAGYKMNLLFILNKKLKSLLIVSLVFFLACASQKLPVRSDPQNFDFKEILPYVERAAATYQTNEDIYNKFGKDVFIYTLRKLKVKVFVQTDLEKKLQWIAVRGTDNLKNVKEDVEYSKIKDPIVGVYFHRGFQKAAMQTYQVIEPKLKKNFSIRITGHSLGGAIAVIIEAYLHFQGYRVEKTITFGQPKVTDRKGMEKLGFLPLLRVINHKDPVPLVPPITLLGAIHGIYRHFGPELILRNPPNFIFLKSHAADRVNVTSFWDNIGDIDVEDHHINWYRKYLNEFADL